MICGNMMLVHDHSSGYLRLILDTACVREHLRAPGGNSVTAGRQVGHKHETEEVGLRREGYRQPPLSLFRSEENSSYINSHDMYMVITVKNQY